MLSFFWCRSAYVHLYVLRFNLYTTSSNVIDLFSFDLVCPRIYCFTIYLRGIVHKRRAAPRLASLRRAAPRCSLALPRHLVPIFYLKRIDIASLDNNAYFMIDVLQNENNTGELLLISTLQEVKAAYLILSMPR